MSRPPHPSLQQMTSTVHRSLLPVFGVKDEVSEHVEGGLRSVGGHHVTRPVDEHEPEVVVCFGPAAHLSVDGPDLFALAFPSGGAFPVQRVQVVEHACSVDHEIVLPVVDQHAHVQLQEGDHVAGVGAGDVGSEGVVDVVVAGHVVDRVGHSECFFAVVEEGCEGGVALAVLPEVVGAHASPVLVAGVVVVGEEVEVFGGLGGGGGTLRVSPSMRCWMALVWNQVQVSRNLLDTTPTE